MRGSLTHTLRAPQGGLLVARLVRDDALAADNAAGILLSPPPAPAIVLVQESREELQSDASWVLIETLRALGPASLTQLTALEAMEMGIDATTDVVIFDGVEPAGVNVAPETAVMTFGVDPDWPSISREQTQRVRGGFVTWQREHPVWRGAEIDTIRWVEDHTLRVEADEASPRVLARSPGGPAVLLDERGGVRRLAVSFRPADSTWTTHYSFALFLANAIEFLTWSGSDNAGVTLTTSDAPALTPGDLGSFIPRRLVTSSGQELELVRAADGTWPLGRFERAGPGTLVAQDGTTQPIWVSVLSDEETLMTGAERDENAEQPDEPADTGEWAEKGTREIWYWFVAAAAALLAVEWLLYAWRARV